MKSVEIHYRGEAAKQKTDALSLVVLKELLSPSAPDMVNLVNAPILAKERGVNVKEVKGGEGFFTTSIVLEAETEKGKHTLEAALSGTEPRIVGIDGYRVDIRTEGSLVLFFNKDVPGMVGKVGTILGEAGINIASLTNGRKEKGGEALSVFNVDGEVTEAVVKKLEAIDGLRGARVVSLS